MILTQTTDDQRYKIPSSLLDELEDMEDGCETEQHDEDDGGHLRGIVSVQNIGVRVIESRAGLVFGHVDGSRSQGV